MYNINDIITKPELFHKLREIPVNISDGVWHHVCIVWTRPLRVYRDGQEVGKVDEHIGIQSIPGKTKTLNLIEVILLRKNSKVVWNRELFIYCFTDMIL